MTHTSKYQRGEINWMLAATIAAIVIAIAAFMYAHDSSQRLASQQATIDQLKATVAGQQDMLDKASTDYMDLQAVIEGQNQRIDVLGREVALLKEAERKRVEKAKAAAKPKPKPKTTTKKSTTTTKKKK